VKIITLPFRVFWKCWIALNFALGLVILYPVFYLLLSNPRHYRKAFRLMRVWAHVIAWGSGIFVVRKGNGNFKDSGPAVYIANHHSYLDILIAYLIIPNYFIFIGKREIQNAPLFNIFFKGMNILVDRQSNFDSHKAFIEAGRRIREGASVFIFPEGGIKNKSGKLFPFKIGAFRMALENGVPLIPVTFCNNFKRLQTGSFLMADAGPGISRVIIGNPVPTEGKTEKDLISLKNHCFQEIEKNLKNYHEA
jgi:1-acyl-sn-glycerol-3-phosphate acyltransferase